MSTNIFKGVMLCSRPSVVSSGGTGSSSKTGPAASSSSGGSRPAFRSAVSNSERWGLNPVASKFRKKANSGKLRKKQRAGAAVTRKHKAWLKQFQKQRTDLVAAMVAETQRVADSRRKFAEREAQKRAEVCQQRVGDMSVFAGSVEEKTSVADAPVKVAVSVDVGHDSYQDAHSDTNAHTDNAHSDNAHSDKHKDQNADSNNDNNDSDKKINAVTADTKVLSRPKWALNAEQVEAKEEGEVDALLDFAESLNFDEYVNDMEVREALKFLKKRVSELETEEREAKTQEERERITAERKQAFADYETRTGQSLDENFLTAADSKTSGDGDGELDGEFVDEHGDGIDETVTGILETHQGIRTIHSKTSVRKLMDTVAKQGDEDDPLAGSQAVANSAIRPPVISTVKENAKKTETRASNLPFLYRNPAI